MAGFLEQAPLPLSRKTLTAPCPRVCSATFVRCAALSGKNVATTIVTVLPKNRAKRRATNIKLFCHKGGYNTCHATVFAKLVWTRFLQDFCWNCVRAGGSAGLPWNAALKIWTCFNKLVLKVKKIWNGTKECWFWWCCTGAFPNCCARLKAAEACLQWDYRAGGSLLLCMFLFQILLFVFLFWRTKCNIVQPQVALRCYSVENFG